jgi:hypothetical protein
MSDDGVFTIHRGAFKHPMFDGEAYTRRDAWFWLIGHAAWKATKTRVGGKIIALERGQCAYSERFLAEKWQWSKSKVHRFLSRLKTEAMIELKADHETNQITICNYDTYQFGGTTDRTESEPASGPEVDQQRTKEEELKKVRTKDHIHSGDENVSREKSSRKAKPSKVPLPSDWTPPARAREIATELSIDVADQESRFRDYLASNGVQYVDYDSAFCNFVRNAPKFNGVRGPPRSNQQPSYQDIASTLGARANAANESGYSGDPRPGTKPGLLELVQPDREPGYRRAGS